MREIKFRAWDKKNKEMIKDIWIAPEYGWSVMSDNDALCERERAERGQIELMQYTGLEDKRGKEIYEGDIVDDNGHINEVQFINASFCVYGVYNGISQHWVIGKARAKHMRVIGNIYQSKELL